MTLLNLILICICSFLGSAAGVWLFGRKAGSEGIRQYLDRKEEELNQKVKRKTF
jgi:membrane protein YqaA with SNARE-associated domain